jgi:hypothetical protein
MDRTPCTTCIPKVRGTSFKEDEVFDYIRSLGVSIEKNDRTVLYPQELDSYAKDNKLAFEFNGLFYHSEIYKSVEYHINKTNRCLSKGIQLVHIYEDDWVYKKNIVKSRISNLFGLSKTIYARKCKVMELSAKETNNFLDENHIQGNCRSKYRYGLFHGDELVSVMTFGISRFTTDIELIRFCNKLHTRVVGGASKLFAHFIKISTVNTIISYADRSWSVGKLYESLGFTYHSTTDPGYSYVVGDMRVSRMRFQKHKLVKEGYDPTMTEHEIMLGRGIYRIYDSGNLKYIWTRK